MLEADILVIRNINSWIWRCDWLVQNFESSVLIGYFFVISASRILLPTNHNTVFKISGSQSNYRNQEFVLRMTKVSGSSIVSIIYIM